MSAQLSIIPPSNGMAAATPELGIISKADNDRVAILVRTINQPRENEHASALQEMEKMQERCLQAVEQHTSLKKALVVLGQDSKASSISHDELCRILKGHVTILKDSLAFVSNELAQVIATYQTLQAQNTAAAQENARLLKEYNALHPIYQKLSLNCI